MSGIKLTTLQETNERMIDKDFREMRKLKKEQKNMRQDNKEVAAEYRTAFEKIKQSEERLNEQKKQITSLDHEINLLKSKSDNSQEIASEWVTLITQQFEILDNLMLQRFHPDSYQELSKHLDLMQTNIVNEHYETTITTGQICHTRMETLLPKIEKEYHEAIVLEEELRNIHLQLTDYVKEKNLKQCFKNSEGKDVVQLIPIDFWAESEWKKIQELKSEIDLQMKNLTDMNVHAMQSLEQLMDQLSAQIKNTRQKALDRYVCSLRIMDMQENIAEKLANIGFEIQDNVFEDNDERKANILILENERNEKILTKFWIKNEEIKMEINFSNLNKLTHNQRLNNILQSVGANEYVEKQGYENKAAEAEKFDLRTYQKASK